MLRWLPPIASAALLAAGLAWLLGAAGSRGPAPAASPSLAALEGLRAADVRAVEVAPPGESAVALTRSASGDWSQPGNWPVRDAEATALLNTLTGLRTRFRPVAVADLAPFGLADDAKVARAVVRTDAGAVTLRFGQPPATEGASPFDRPCYVRVDEWNEVVRLGPEAFAAVSRPAEAYRRRLLLPGAERVKVTGGDADANNRVPLPGDAVSAIRFEKGAQAVGLRRLAPNPRPSRTPDRPTAEPALPAARLALAWEVATPGEVRDAADPARLLAALSAVADLWVEKFVPEPPADAGLEKPEFTLTVERSGGPPLAVRFGKVSRTLSRAEEQPPPQPFAPPPPPPKVTTEEYRYAQLDGNDLVFELRWDKLAELFGDPARFRDPLLVRADAADITQAVVARPGQPDITLTRRRGNKDAESEDDRADRWLVNAGPAEEAKVTELIDAVLKIEAMDAAGRIDNPAPDKLKELGLDTPAATLTLTIQPRAAEGDSPPPARVVTVAFGRENAGKVAARLAGSGAVRLADAGTKALAERAPLAYRGRRLFDAGDSKLTTLAVEKPDGGFELRREPAGEKWSLTQPAKLAADAGAVGGVAGELSRLEVAEYVDDAPSADDLKGKYGLQPPSRTLKLGFSGPDAAERAIQIGAARPEKDEIFARLNGAGGVFAIASARLAELDKGPLAFLPLQLWTVPGDKVVSLEVRRGPSAGNESYRLTRDGGRWSVSGAFDAPAGAGASALATAASAVTAERAEALSAADPAKYGFDKPSLRLTMTALEGAPAEKPVARTLVVGGPAPGGRFARLEGPVPVVYVVPESLVKEADQGALARLDPALLDVDPSAVTKLEIASPGGKPVALTKGADGRWSAGADFPLDAAAADELARLAARPPVARLADYGSFIGLAAYGLDAPAFTLTVGTADASHTVEIGKAEANGDRFVRVDRGPAVGVLPKSAAEALARDRLGLADRTLLSFDPIALASLTRKRGADVLKVARSGSGWEVRKPAKQKGDAPSLDELAEQLAKLRAVRVAALDPAGAELAKFGLATDVTLAFDGSPERLLRIGNPVDEKSPRGERFALAPPSGGKGPLVVGVIPAALANRLLAAPLAFRDRALAKFTDADSVTVARGGREATFARKGGNWRMTAPVAAEAEQADLDELVNSLGQLQADELVAEKPGDLKPFGLDPPEAALTLTDAGKPALSLLVGAKEPNGPRVYAKVSTGESVALLDAGLSARVLGEFRRRQVWSDVDASQAEALVVSTRGANTVLRKGGRGWLDAGKPVEPLDQAKVTELIAAFADLKAERYVEDGPGAEPKLYGLADPSRVLVLTARGGPPKTLHLGGKVAGTKGKQVYAKVADADRPEIFVLSEADTAKLTQERPALAGK